MRERTRISEIDGTTVEERAVQLEPETISSREVDFIDLLLVLARNKKKIAVFTIAVALLAVIVSLLLPKMYTATATILPPQQSQSSLNSMLGQIGALTGLASGDLGLKNPSDLFAAMLRSRSIADRLVDRFDLRKAYGVKTYQDARKKLEGDSQISAGDEGLITIAVRDRDPKRAADLANAYIEELHSLNDRLAISEAAQRRLFYQQKLDAEKEDLSQAELALEQVQQKSGLIQPEAQGKAIVDAVANSRAQVAMQEVRIQAMRSYATPNNPDLQRAEEELAGLRAQLARLQRDTGEVGNGNLAVPTRRLPQVELDYLRRIRDVKYHESVFEFLSKQLEAARIDEAKDAVVVQVVDKAATPEKKSSPHRLLIVLVSKAGGGLLSCLWVLLAESIERKRQNPADAARLALLRRSLTFSSWNS